VAGGAVFLFKWFVQVRLEHGRSVR
jgi:hypothetical protein